MFNIINTYNRHMDNTDKLLLNKIWKNVKMLKY